MLLFRIEKSGKLQALEFHQTDVVKEEINLVLYMLRELENLVRLLHDDFAKALKFGEHINHDHIQIK